MNLEQIGILEPVPAHARYLQFDLADASLAMDALRRVAALSVGADLVVGFGQPLVAAAGRAVPGLTLFPTLEGGGVAVPATPTALWCWLRGTDRGDLLHQGQRLIHALAPALPLSAAVDGFRHDGGRDLTGYEDGTENPEGDAAREAALVAGQGAGLDGGSFVAVQQWRHDFDAFAAMSVQQQDHAVGRRRSDNEELDDAPESAHVKRTAQESFDPEAFVLRRSMPWSEGGVAGLMFVAFGRSFAAFEAQMRRMIGAEDGVVDGLFRFTRPVSGAYFWCPPVLDGRLDLRILGLA